MTTIIGQELKKWKESLILEELDNYDITVANIILEHYEELEKSGGTAVGKRISKFAELVNSKNGVCEDCLFEIKVGDSLQGKKIKRIKSLEVDSFRGFATSRKFDLKKQYVLLYGPNGSGKTSFSEALEYGLLGSIEEAETDNIRLSTYIKNTTTKKGIAPIISCLYEDGSEGIATEDYEVYRFAFVEKNRITDFSHISSLNSKNQSERMAALFGLSEFTTFVQGFSKNCDEKYLPVISDTEQAFKEKKAVRDAKNNELITLQGDLEKLQQSEKEEINSLSQKNGGIITLQQAIDYYDDVKTGVLALKLQNKDKQTVKVIEIETFAQIKSLCNEIDAKVGSINSARSELATKALEVNYKKLYETLSKLDETEECPACGTPIINAVRNPYKYAKEKIGEFKELDRIKQSIHSGADECKSSIDELQRILENNDELLHLMFEEILTFDDVSSVDIEKMEKTVTPWIEVIHRIIKTSDEEMIEKIKSYNILANEKNEAYSKEINELKEKEKSLVLLSTQLSEKMKLVEESKRFIAEFDKNSTDILQKIAKEKERVEYNSKIIGAYRKIIDKLNNYTERLPELIAQDLEEKIVDYYNVINSGDAAFEMLSKISLPKGDSSKIILSFKDGSTSDALQVLSEGHIKILGLSILLAKAQKDNLHFLIFDDIVNAIDDEHRNGVANLLTQHEDFKEVQMILSTHGDQFIMKLKDRLGSSRSSKDAVIYKFLPAESLTERGVIVEYSDAKTPIEAARKKFDDSEYKDAASKCRQAMESVSYNLWNKISTMSNGEISVAMRTPKSQPDLASIVNALLSKCKKISGTEQISQKLEEIKRQDNWRVLNKGTHFEDEQPEFDRDDVRNVLDILTKLDELVRDLKIQSVAV